MTDVQSTIMTVVNDLLRRTDKGDLEVTLESPIHGDGLDLDSLETAELSAVLEETFGSDPFGAGLSPETVGEIIDYYTEGGGSDTSLPA